ncbi:hypothetical protein CYMTET_43660 [Cymbomonas tetramitiformis]|uniref:Uncharacterized protein n=1 Tax=Cymbomonas tetramitiformis TaxID=36881 RepID=A0AAE0C3E4_9CHLO|nr:hypothetical protein CYMTET_43660 [Cymbomonas tetramitiformis]
MTKALFEAQARMYMQEQLGIPSGTDSRCFDSKAIDRLAARGGETLCGILAADTTPVTSDRQLEDEIHSHAAGLRVMLGAYTEIVSVIEANYGGWVQRRWAGAEVSSRTETGLLGVAGTDALAAEEGPPEGHCRQEGQPALPREWCTVRVWVE